MKSRKVPKKLKGTVLYTVVSVMMVLIVFLMGTLALAATANNRAMNNFTAAQTQATAKTGVEAILSAMQNDKTIAKAASLVSPTNPHVAVNEVSVRGQTDMGSMGHIEDAGIEYYGTKWVLDTDTESPTYGQLEEVTVVKIWATARQGNQTSTYAAYLTNGYHAGGGGGGGGGGFVTTGSAENGTKTSAFGGTYIGYDNGGVGSDLWIGNTNTVIETDFAVNGDCYQQTGVDYVFKGQGSGMTIWGSYWLGNGDMGISTVNAMPRTLTSAVDGIYSGAADFSGTGSTVSYTKVPFIYVDGIFASGTASVIKFSDDAKKMPMNVFCGQLDFGKTMDVYADVYCYNKPDGSTISVDFQKSDGTVGATLTDPKGISYIRGDGYSQLYQWSSTVLDLDGNNETFVSGDYYTKGDLVVKSSPNSNFAQNVYIEGNLTVGEGTMKVTGDLYVGGSINLSGGNLNVTGHIYCDNAPGVPGAESYMAKVAPSMDPSRTIPGSNTIKPGYTQSTVSAIIDPSYTFGTTTYSDVYWVKSGSNEHIAVAHNVGWNEHISQEGDGTIKWYKYDYAGNLQDEQVLTPPTYTVYTRDADGTEVTEDEAMAWNPPQYFDASGNPIISPSLFPEEFEKDVVTGAATVGTHAKEDTQIVKTVADVLNSNVNPYATEFAVPSTYEADVAAHSYTAPTAANSTMEIATSGTLNGTTGNGCKIIFKVPTGVENWIVINNLNMQNDSQLVLDTSDPTHYGGKLNILITGKLESSSNNDNIPITTSTVQALLQSGDTFQLYTDPAYAVPGVASIGQIPINIYSSQTKLDGSGHAIAGTKPELKINNQCMLVANIRAPYMTYNCGSKSWDFSNKVYYNGFPVRSGRYGNTSTSLGQVGVIGCCVVGEVTGQANDFLLLYVPIPTTSTPLPSLDDALMTSWTIQYYENY